MLLKGAHHIISNPEHIFDGDETIYKYKLPKSIQEQFGTSGPLTIRHSSDNPQNFLVQITTENRIILQFAHPQMITELGFDYIGNGIYSLPSGHVPEESILHGFCKGTVAVMVEHSLKDSAHNIYITSPKIALVTMQELEKDSKAEVSSLQGFSEWVEGLNIEQPQVTSQVASDVELL